MKASPKQEAVPWPEVAHAFISLFAQLEKSLKDSGQIKRGRKVAEADWSAFADSLGSAFFDRVQQSGKAENLIKEPPRRRMADGLVFSPETPLPLGNIQDLIVLGVCRVRNNLVHGEKFGVSGVGWERDEILTREARWVLQKAVDAARPL
jgi:hypothetical protein